MSRVNAEGKSKKKKQRYWTIHMSFGIKLIVIYQKKSWVCIIASAKRILIF